MSDNLRLIICDKCGGEFGAWDYRRVKNRRMPICKACEAEKKAKNIRKKQEESAANHLIVQEVRSRNTHEWEHKARVRANDI